MPVIRPAAPADFAQIALTATRAFADDPVMRWLFPDDDYHEMNPLLIGHLARRWHATDSLWCTEDCAAIAGWIPPGRPEPDVGEWPSLEHPPDRMDRFEHLGAAMIENTPPEPHWYLNMLATHPDWQRRGFGSALMTVVFDLIDGQGLPCYLETETVENVAYYRRHGFMVRTEWDLGGRGPHMWGMVRPPR